MRGLDPKNHGLFLSTVLELKLWFYDEREENGGGLLLLYLEGEGERKWL